MHASQFVSSEPVLLRVAKSSEEYDSEHSFHYCEDERSSPPSTKFEPVPDGLEFVVLDLDRDTTMTFHDASLEMESQWAMELRCHGTNEHGSSAFDILQKPCSFNATPESSIFSAPCTHEDYNQLKVLFCKIFRRLVVDIYVYRKYCRFRGCTVALTL